MDKAKIYILKTPLYGDKGDHVKRMQESLNYKDNAGLLVDGHFGEKTKKAVSSFQKKNGLNGYGIPGDKTLGLLNLIIEKPNPQKKIDWFLWAKKHQGKKESDVDFQNEMNPYWKLAGLPQFKGLVGSARAWCALFILASLSATGYKFTKGNAAAISWDNWGQKIEWQTNGFPQGAVIRINSKGNCKSGSGNHVTFANGDCAPQDLLKAGATFSGYGGNQGNQAKVSTYSVNKICSVRWPLEVEIPVKVLISKNCSNGKTEINESTR